MRRPWKWFRDTSRRHQLAERRREQQQIAEALVEMAEDASWEDWDCEEHGHIFVMGQPHCLVCEAWEPEPEDLLVYLYGDPDDDYVRWQG